MLKKLARLFGLQLFFLFFASTGQAENIDMSPVFRSTEELMEKDASPFFSINNQANLLQYMVKYGDKTGVARLTKKISAHSATETEVGTYTFLETQLARAEIFLGQPHKAKSRAQKALAHAPTLWVSHGHDRPFNSYIDLMGIFLETGANTDELSHAIEFLNKVAKAYREDTWRHQLYQSLGRMWVKANHINNAKENFRKAAEIALTFPSGKGRQNKRMNYLLSIASFQGQAGLIDDMAETISLIDTNDGEAIKAAWETIKATIDFTYEDIPE